MPEVSYTPNPKGNGVPALLSRQYGCRECGSGGEILLIQTFTTPGAASSIAPAGATSVIAEVWGAGGGGMSDDDFASVGGGGGGGAYAKSTIAVTAGNSYNYFVGTGGAAGIPSGAPGQNGTGSWFSAAGILFAHFGAGSTSGFGGIGGLIASSVGLTRLSGGNGGTASAAGGGCGGGGSAGSAANGNNGTTGGPALGGPGGVAVFEGGAGGTGANIAATPGNPGASPGGGGAGCSAGTATAGGAGGNGKVRLTYMS